VSERWGGSAVENRLRLSLLKLVSERKSLRLDWLMQVRDLRLCQRSIHEGADPMEKHESKGNNSKKKKPFSTRALFAESRPGLLKEYLKLNDQEGTARFVPVQQVARRLRKHPRTIQNWCEW
jgi:hypothetical protein